MNPLNLFKFLEKEKGKRIPLTAKLRLGLPFIPEELDIKGSLDFSHTDIASLPKGLEVEGGLDLTGTPLTSLPQGLKVGEQLYLLNTPLTSLPQGLKVGSDLVLENSSVESLPPDLQVGGSLWLGGTPLAKKTRSTLEIIQMVSKGGGYIKGRIILK